MAVEPRPGDDQLLDALAVVLAPAPDLEPSMAELAALRRAVAATGSSGGEVRGARIRRRFAVVAAVLVVGSGGTAYANSPSSPRPVRSVAHAVKVPGVEAPDLTDARKALDDLAEALAEDRVRTDEVRAELADLDEELAELSAEERAGLEPQLTALRTRAAQVLAGAASAETAERSGSGRDEGAEVEVDGPDDSSGKGSGSGSGSSGSGSSGSGSSGSGSGSSGSGTSGSSGSGSSSSGSSGSGSSGSGSSGSGSSGSSSGSSGSGSGDTTLDTSGGSGSGSSGSGSDDHVEADELDG